jgi:hypothetical protein
VKRLFSGLRRKAGRSLPKPGTDDERFGTGLWRHNRDRFIRAVDRYYTTAVALHEARPSSDATTVTAASAKESLDESDKDPIDVIVDGTHRLNALVDVVDAITADLHTRFPISGQVVPGSVRNSVGDVPELLTKASSKVGEAVLAASMARTDAQAGRPIGAGAQATERFVADAEELLGRARENLDRLEPS